MAIELKSIGRLTVVPSNRTEFENGPHGTRGVANFAATTWEGDLINAEMIWGNGCYTTGPDGTWEPEIRLMMRTDDNALIFLNYWARMDRQKLMRKEIPGPMLAGRIETIAPKYQWLNETHVVGEGYFTSQFNEQGGYSVGDVIMAYDMYALLRK